MPTMDPLLLLARALLAIAALAVVPLGLGMGARVHRDGRALRPVPLGVCLAAAAWLVAALALPAGPLAGLLVVPWLALAARCALFSLQRFAGRSRARLSEIAVDVGLLHLPIGAAWALVERADLEVLGFGGTRALLTAAHFHVAGFGACVLAGMIGRALPDEARVRRAIWRVATVVTLAGVMALAVGITYSRPLERTVALLLAAAVAALGVLLATLAPPRALARALLLCASASAAIAMLQAARFAGIGFAALDGDTFRRMVITHGAVNTIGFVLAGLVAFRLWAPPSRENPAGIPFSRLAARGRVGPRFFEDAELVDPDRTPPPRGLTDTFADLGRPDFDAAACAPAVRAFYEHTADHELTVRADWTPLFRLPGRLWHALARRFGQLAIPVGAPDEAGAVTSRILPLRDDRDGRTAVRAWIRTHRTDAGDEGEVIYVAAYSSHTRDGVRYMNIAFPLPLGNMTSVLHLAPLGQGGGVRLSTRPPATAARDGDEGVWAVTRLGALRLPLDETIDVRPAPPGSPPDITVLATHDMWLLGFRYVRLTYTIGRRATRAAKAE